MRILGLNKPHIFRNRYGYICFKKFNITYGLGQTVKEAWTSYERADFFFADALHGVC